jgi:magnesium chelatase family protein
MNIARIASRAQLGLHAPPVQVEVHLGAGLPFFSIVGLPAAAVRESKERVRAALINSNFEFPAGRITVNLAPADLPKEGGRYDLPIAVGILCASGQLAAQHLDRTELYGELGLGGEIKSVKGLLLAAAHARESAHAVVVPRANAAEVALAAPPGVFAGQHLLEVCAHLTGLGGSERRDQELALRTEAPDAYGAHRESPDLCDVRGQLQAKRALAIAAAGAHSLLLIGPPGAGKSMLAQRLAPLLPPLDRREALEVATIASVGGQPFDPAQWARRPFRAPHHTASAHAIVGGGPRARPGEVSLAHNGVLFLDELPEFDRRVLEALREPLEAGSIAIARAELRAEYPARFQLVAAMNPCPCGYHGDPSDRCRCKEAAVARYRARVSGPLLDRIDLRLEIAPVAHDELAQQAPNGETTAQAAQCVAAARSRQLARAGKLNAHLTIKEVARDCALGRESTRLLAQGRLRLGLSARGHHRVLRVARTIADFAGSESIESAHLAEALQLRRAL